MISRRSFLSATLVGLATSGGEASATSAPHRASFIDPSFNTPNNSSSGASGANEGDGNRKIIDAIISNLEETSIVRLPNIESLRAYIGKYKAALIEGYYTSGDGGGGVFIWNDGASSPDDSGFTIKPQGDIPHGRWQRMPEGGTIDVRWFGARGDGRFDDTIAIDSAHKASIENPNAGIPLLFSPGRYRYSGNGLNQESGKVSIIAAPGSVEIGILSDVYLLTCTDKISATFVSGITTIGGRGFIEYKLQTENVTQDHIFQDCVFRDYRECAITNNAADHPYLKIQRCVFRGSREGGNIGVAWGGYIDALSIQDCSFLINAYHLKIGPHLSGSALILHNDFITLNKKTRIADIWIVPNTTDAGAKNAGAGFTISSNKFGNENQGIDDVRILVATEDTSGPRHSRARLRHSNTWNSSNAYVQGINISDNRICGIEFGDAPFIRSHISNLWRVNIRNNFFDGGSYTYLAEFEGQSPSEELNYNSFSWQVSLGPTINGRSAFKRAVSNRSVGIIQDMSASAMAGNDTLLHSATGDDAGYFPLASHPRQSFIESDGVSVVNSPYKNGEISTDIHIIKSHGSIALSLSRPQFNRMTWIDMVIKSGDKTSQQLTIQITNSEVETLAFRQSINVDETWKSVRIPFIFPDSRARSGWNISLLCAQGHLSIRHLHVYCARQAMTSGHIRTIGSGTWDREHIVMGVHHLWIDDTGYIRISDHTPLSDTDGRKI